jgi:hypothetical protein
MSAEDPPSAESPARPATTEALIVPPKAGPLTDDPKTQQLWIALQRRPWRSLAVVSASKGVGTLKVANDLAKIAWWYSGQPTCVFDMRDLSLRLLEHQLREMGAQLKGGERVFIALRSSAENPTAVPLARAADAAVLCVQLGTTDFRSAERTLDAVGRTKFIGTILVSADDEAADGSPPAGTDASPEDGPEGS